MNPYLLPLARVYKQQANADNAFWMKKYMKGQFEFFGIKSPERSRINRDFLVQYGLPQFSQLEAIVTELMQQPWREFQYFAISLVGKMERQWVPNSWMLFEQMILTQSWWDTVDTLASRTLGDFFRRFPELTDSVTAPWNQSQNFWLVRTILLFQLRYKKNTDQELLFKYIVLHLDSREFFVQKAIGWALRQYARTNPEAVFTFVNSHQLASLSRREALKYLKV